MPSESSTVRSLKSTLLGRAGRVPTAITIFSAVTRRRTPSSPETVTVLASVNCPLPVRMRTWFRESWSRTTSASRLITACVRQKRSDTVTSSFTR